jgi:hypothetical protein
MAELTEMHQVVVRGGVSNGRLPGACLGQDEKKLLYFGVLLPVLITASESVVADALGYDNGCRKYDIQMEVPAPCRLSDSRSRASNAFVLVWPNC